MDRVESVLRIVDRCVVQRHRALQLRGHRESHGPRGSPTTALEVIDLIWIAARCRKLDHDGMRARITRLVKGGHDWVALDGHAAWCVDEIATDPCCPSADAEDGSVVDEKGDRDVDWFGDRKGSGEGRSELVEGAG